MSLCISVIQFIQVSDWLNPTLRRTVQDCRVGGSSKVELWSLINEPIICSEFHKHGSYVQKRPPWLAAEFWHFLWPHPESDQMRIYARVYIEFASRFW